jgi:hypothetical protein
VKRETLDARIERAIITREVARALRAEARRVTGTARATRRAAACQRVESILVRQALGRKHEDPPTVALEAVA